MLDDLIETIARKKARLDGLRPLSGGALKKHFDVDLTMRRSTPISPFWVRR